MKGLAYVSQFYGLRAIGVSAVLLTHFSPQLSRLLLPTGYYGVRLFFVLSGYLITRILLEGRDLRESGQETTAGILGRFYARRALRLLPALWLALAAALIFLPEVRGEWAWHVSYLSNVYFILHGGLPESTGHLWTLAVEEQFYLVWPILVLGLARWRLAPIVIILALAAPLIRYYLADIGASGAATYTTPLASADSLGVGILLALWLYKSPDPQRLCVQVRNWCVPVGLALTAAVHLTVLFYSPLHAAFAGLAISVLSAGLVAGCIVGFRGPFGRLLDSKPAAYLGRISYGVYVYHFFLLSAWKRYAPDWLPNHPGWNLSAPITLEQIVYLLMMSALSIAIASASWHWFEQPILGLKRHLSYRAKRMKVETRIVAVT